MLAFDPVSGTGNSINVCCGQLGLTVPLGAAILTTADTFSTGRENLVSTTGEKIATLKSGFFVPTIQHGVMPCLLCYGGLITGKLSAWLHQLAVSHPVFSPSPNAVRSISDGYSRSTGVTA